MPKVTIYQFTIYDVRSDGSQTSRRWGTLQGIKTVGGAPLLDSAVDLDASLNGAEVFGLTERDYNPRARMPGLLTRVS